MCLTINIKIHCKGNIGINPLIVEKDLYTLKVANFSTKEFSLSYFRLVEQQFNKLLESKIEIYSDLTIEEGLHSLLINEKEFNEPLGLIDFNDEIISREIILCKIPKGAQYYIGSNQDIVSNQLILLEPLVYNNKSRIKLKTKSEKELMSIQDAYKEAVKIYLSYYKTYPKYY